MSSVACSSAGRRVLWISAPEVRLAVAAIFAAAITTPAASRMGAAIEMSPQLPVGTIVLIYDSQSFVSAKAWAEADKQK